MSKHTTLITQTPIVLILLCTALLYGCAGRNDTEALATATEAGTSVTPIPVTQVVQAQTPTAQPTPQGPLGLVVWWPEPLAPLDNETAAEALSEQLTAFQRENEDISVEFRLKKVEEVGGIMATLRTANAVAPGALPDLTLLRREDLLIAAQAGLIQPLSGRLSPAVLEDLQEIGLELGQVGGELYGMSYTLEVQHIAYPAETPSINDWSFSGVLGREIPFLFPAGRNNGINHILLVQYLAAGGELAVSGQQVIDVDALREPLTFYENAVEAGLINSAVLEYTNPRDYTDALTAGDSVAVVVTSTLYRQLMDRGIELKVGPIPTSSGRPITLVDGWIWVLTTPDAERQARALRFLNWMLDAERQAEYTNVIHMLPSQRTALRQMNNPQYSAFVAELLTNAILPQTENESGAAARAMQNALIAVITGQRTAEAAAQEVVDQFTS